MSFDTNMQKTAQRLINKRGKTVTYSYVTTGTYDPTTGSAAATVVDANVKAIVDSVPGIDMIANTLVEKNNKIINIASLSLVRSPIVNDRVAIDGESYSIYGVGVVYAGELPAIYNLVARRN